MESTSRGERAYRRLRGDILSGRLLPAARLTLDRLRDSHDASVGTLREALSRLASEGLVVAEGARGFQVAPVSAANLRELASLRLLLECDALAQSCRTGDVEWEGRVVAAQHKLAAMEDRMEAGDRAAVDGWKRYDREFHQALISACGSRMLLETHAAVCDKYMRYLMVVGLYRGEIASREHRALLKLALKRDWRAAQQTLRTHVQDCVDYIERTGLIERFARTDAAAGQRHEVRREAAEAAAHARARRAG